MRGEERVQLALDDPAFGGKNTRCAFACRGDTCEGQFSLHVVLDLVSLEGHDLPESDTLVAKTRLLSEEHMF